MPTYEGTFLPDVIIGSPGDDTINGNGGNDIIFGGGGNDTINGGAGADTMSGGTGDDTYIVNVQSGDTVNYFSLLPILGIQLFPATVVDVLGDTAQIRVNLGNGEELLTVSLGSIQPFGETINEAAGEGLDTIRSSVSYTLQSGTFVENLRTTSDAGTTSINLTGNEIDNTITGNDGKNVLSGNQGDDVLFGLGDDDALAGGEGNDFLVGGAGVDTMAGGAGSDTYSVDNAGDVAAENMGEGSDRVAASVDYTLATGSEIEILDAEDLNATTPLNLTGNEIANIINGNAGSNVLRGEGGDDVIAGGGGDDFLVGGQGNDSMSGGFGDDTFYVESAGDQVYEIVGGGNDRVATSGSYTLTAGQEIETLEAITISATDDFVLTGNEFDQTIVGNNGNNVLIGGGGKDTLAGNLGDDTFYVSNSETVILESENGGNDRVATSVSLELTGGAEVETLEAINLTATDALDLTGSDFANTVIGNNGANVINGRGGSDTLYGLGGSDVFEFTSALGAGNVDRIADFASGTDTIALDDAVFTALATGQLGAGAFATGTQAADADDRIIYDSDTGALYYDADGNGSGAAVQFATLSAGLTLSASDFVVI